MRNRTDDEAFDYYFAGDNRFWKVWSFYSILWGGFWLCIAASNLVLPFRPRLMSPRTTAFDRPTEALLESFNPRYDRFIRLEAIAIWLLHGTLIWVAGVPWTHWALLIAAFGISWSSMQYMHHYGTERDVHKGALNLRTWRWLDALWLNHNWHRRHHEQPNIPWIHLPGMDGGSTEPRESMLKAWSRQWRGPRFTHDRITSKIAGKQIR